MQSEQETPAIEGILLVDKPAGKSSFFLVHILRKLTKVKKIGHAGTLDPFATGVMVMLIGKKYTRMSDQFLSSSKEYIAKVRLGITTDTYDITGEQVSTNSAVPSLADIERCLLSFQGDIEQTPPMFSAKKVGGKKLYELARIGKTIERKKALVNVSCQLLEYTYPHLMLKVACSKGTYIRSIAHDLGESLGCGATLEELRRTKSGNFRIENCLPFEDLKPGIDLSSYLISTP